MFVDEGMNLDLLMSLSLFSLEHRGGGKVHPGSDEPDAGPQCLLQPVLGDGV